MNSYIIASLIFLSGVCAYAAMNHAFMAIKHPLSPIHFLFAVICALLVAFELSHLKTYTAVSLEEYIPWLKGEYTVIFLEFAVLPWFVAKYSAIGHRWFLSGLTLCSAALIVVNAFQPYSLQFTTIDRLDYVEMPWGETITHPVGATSVTFVFVVAVVMVNLAFAFAAFAMRYYRDRMGTTLVMLIAMVAFIATAIEGILVRLKVIDFIHLGSFGVLALIIAMSMALSREMQQKLRASEIRYRSLVEQSPFSIQVLSRDGRTLQVNHAWESLWGMQKDRIADFNMLQDMEQQNNSMMEYLKQGFNGVATEIPPSNYSPMGRYMPMPQGSRRWVRAFVYPVKDEFDQVREVVLLHEDVTDKKRFEDAIHLIATGVSTETGEGFFQQLAKYLSQLFETRYAFIGVMDTPDTQQVRTLAVYANGEQAPNMIYDLEGTPCAMVMGQHTCVFPCDVQDQFPQDHLLVEMGAEGYVGTPLFDPKGNPLGIIVLIDDKPLHDVEQMKAIMEIFAARSAAEIVRNKADELLHQHRKHLEEMVEHRTAELQAANKELEAFSYSVSHDLRAPLRSIDGFSQMLTEDYAHFLDEEGKDFLQRIRGNAQRMATLIDDLLKLSRVTRKEINTQPVDLSGMASELIKKYHEQEPSRTVATKFAVNIFVNGDPDLLSIALDNLISNAWKYTSKTKNAVIEFGTRRNNDKTVYYIKDNGAGFNMEHAGKLFDAFQRLHTNKDFEGTGIGLAIVKRIINRHGGEIWGDAKMNSGATFYFSLPES